MPQKINLSPINPRQQPQQSRPFFNFLLQAALIAIIFFASGFILGQKKIEYTRKNFVPNIKFINQTPKDETVDFSLFWKVYEALPQKYIDKTTIDGQKLLYGAIAGMVRSLGDPYTAFLDPKQNEAIKSELSGSYEGIGIQIGFNKDKRLVVIAPLHGTPAEKAGLLPKDLILKIEDKDTFDLTLPEAVDLIRGPRGTRVKLVLEHAGQDKTYEATIQRTQIDIKSVEVTYRTKANKKIAIIKVSRFGDKTDGEWNDAVNDVVGNNPAAIIVDMRNNPGGLLTSSVHLASEFVSGPIVGQQYSDGSVSQLKSDHQGKLLKSTLIVLVNGGSASAAEIFAGAIQDNNRGKIVGEKTFGKGTVQDVVDFPGGSGLHVTIAKWLTPKGKSINGTGIGPDAIIESLLAEKNQDQTTDLQLEKTLDLL